LIINDREAGTTLWVKASRSSGTADCVEMWPHAGRVEVRDTKDQGAGPFLRFGRTEFAA
jgi:hypothetical protein